MQHQWAALIMIPISEVTVDPDTDDLGLYFTEAAEEIGKEEAKIICWHCNVGLDKQSYYTECEAAMAVPSN